MERAGQSVALHSRIDTERLVDTVERMAKLAAASPGAAAVMESLGAPNLGACRSMANLLAPAEQARLAAALAQLGRSTAQHGASLERQLAFFALAAELEPAVRAFSEEADRLRRLIRP